LQLISADCTGQYSPPEFLPGFIFLQFCLLIDCFINLLIFFMNIFVANLSFKIQDQGLQKIFEQYGEVSSAKVITDRETGRSKGYGFVEMPSDEDALAAIRALDGRDLEGKAVVVKQARPREEFKDNYRKSRY